MEVFIEKLDPPTVCQRFRKLQVPLLLPVRCCLRDGLRDSVSPVWRKEEPAGRHLGKEVGGRMSCEEGQVKRGRFSR